MPIPFEEIQVYISACKRCQQIIKPNPIELGRECGCDRFMIPDYGTWNTILKRWED